MFWLVFFVLTTNAFAVTDEDSDFICTGDIDFELAQHQKLFLKIQDDVNKIDDAQLAKRFYDMKIENDNDGISYIKSKSCLQLLGQSTFSIQFKEVPEGKILNNFVDTFLSVLLATSITGVITYFIAIKQIKKTLEVNTKDTIKRNTSSLVVEVRGINSIFESAQTITVILNGRNIRYWGNIFSTSTFDGMIASGELSHFDEIMQTSIEQFYFRIQMHNKILYKMRDAQVTASIHSITWNNNMISIFLTNISRIDELLSQMAPELIHRLGD